MLQPLFGGILFAKAGHSGIAVVKHCTMAAKSRSSEDRMLFA